MEKILDDVSTNCMLVCKLWHQIILGTKFMVNARLVYNLISQNNDYRYRKIVNRGTKEYQELIIHHFDKIMEKTLYDHISEINVHKYSVYITYNKRCIVHIVKNDDEIVMRVESNASYDKSYKIYYLESLTHFDMDKIISTHQSMVKKVIDLLSDF